MCPRHGMTELDEILLDVMPRVAEGLKFLVVLTKADKLTRSEGAKRCRLPNCRPAVAVMLFSAPKRTGIGTSPSYCGVGHTPTSQPPAP